MHAEWEVLRLENVGLRTPVEYTFLISLIVGIAINMLFLFDCNSFVL
jgi:hypothetical protein